MLQSPTTSDFSLRKRPHSVKVLEDKWSLLPHSLLWMIKDKLDVFDDMRLTAVCRNWWVASAGYEKQSVGDGMPWVMQWTNSLNTTVRDFICLQRNKRFTVDLPEFYFSRMLFSRQGWMLLFQVRSPWREIPDGVVLVNPFLKATIRMPDLKDRRLYAAGCFSTREGFPQCVVLLISSAFDGLLLQAAVPGDRVWTRHSYIPQRIEYSMGNGLLLIRQNVYCYDHKGNMVIYNMGSQAWKELPTDCMIREPFKRHIVELEGRLLRLEQTLRCTYPLRLSKYNDHNPFWELLENSDVTYRVFEYNDSNTSWELLDNSDVKDICWFLQGHSNCYAVRKHGSKAYVLTQENFAPEVRWYFCRTHDLVDGTREKVFSVHSSAVWVDVG